MTGVQTCALPISSADSRNADLGTVDTRYILGRAICVLLPFQDFRMLV